MVNLHLSAAEVVNHGAGVAFLEDYVAGGEGLDFHLVAEVLEEGA